MKEENTKYEIDIEEETIRDEIIGFLKFLKEFISNNKILVLCMIIGCVFMMMLFHMEDKSKETQYNRACELQNNSYEVYVNGEKNNNIDISKMNQDNYSINIDEAEKEIIINNLR